jgi:transposase InsO family protein
MDLWEIVEDSEEPPPSDADLKVTKDYQRRVKKAMSVIGLNLVDNQLAHIKSCKGPAEAWKTLCNIHETRSLSNILFIRRKFFTCKMEEGDNLLDHINKVKALADQLTCLEVPLRDEDVVMTLLDSLPPSYEYLITALETRPINELTMDFVTARLMHEMSKRKEKEKEPQGDDSAMFSRQGKGANQVIRKDTKTCYYCGKQGHIARFCFKAKNKDKENANHAKDEDDYAFATQDGAHSNTMCKWIMDSGATKHMTPHRAAFHTYEVISPRNVHMGDDSIVQAIGMGTIVVEVMTNGQTKRIRIKDALHVPKLHANLLSVSKLLSSGLKVKFHMNECIVKTRDGKVVAIAPREGNLYKMAFTKVHEGADVVNMAQSSSNEGALELWHRRLGHLNMKSVHALQNMVSGMNLGKLKCPTSSLVCEGCIEGKLHRAAFPSDGGRRATKPLEIVHSDVCGPMRTTSIGGARYFVTYIDDFSRKVWVYILKSKGEVFEKFKEFKALVETQSEHKIKVFRSDNGGEFISKGLRRFLKEHGIEKQTSTPYRPQQNGVAERANRTIVEMARSMLHAQNLKKSFWAEAVVNAVYTRNRCPTRTLPSITPQEAWSGRKPCISHMRVFGCIAYAMVPDEKRGKLDAKGTKCLFLGYCEGTKAYRLMDVGTKKIIKCRDVVFMEDCMSVSNDLEMRPSGRIETPKVVVMDESSKSLWYNNDATNGIEREEKEVGDAQGTNQEDNGETPKQVCSSTPNMSNEASASVGEEGQPLEERRYPLRERRPLGEWWISHIEPQHDEEHANVASFDDPQTLSEAMQSEDANKWEDAMTEEYESLMSKGTWELAPLPKTRKSIGCKWVFRTKRNALGEVTRHKARLVAKGYSQIYGVDFNETFAPVAKFNTIRCILAIGATYDLEMHQMDVKTAYLNPSLQEEIYMDQPKGFIQEGREHLKCKLKKAIYGLKQSGREWYNDIDGTLANEGFTRSDADHSLYIKQTSEYLLIVIVYVDDLIILASNMTMMKVLKDKLQAKYEMSDLGELHFCLGVEFKRDRVARTITMSQTKYLEDVLKRFDMQDCKPLGTPLDVHSKLPKLTDEELKQYEGEMEGIPYKQAVGSLMYAMVATRADLAYAVSVVSQYMAKAGPMHWKAVKRIMRYLKGTLDFKLCLGGKHVTLRGYCDADWAGDTNDRRSTTGYVFFVGNGAISWNSKRQPTIALSTTEAEYMATSQCTKEALWLRKLLDDVGYVQDKATLIMCDNQGSIALAKNPTHHSRTKHIDIQHHFIREKLEKEEIELKYCPTEDMVADVLTKALAKERHQTLTKAMGLKTLDYSQSGSVGG